MIFTNWKEFFTTDTTLMNMRKPFKDTGSMDVSEEERYQYFKTRLISEVVAKETITYFGDIVGTKVYELGEKE